MNKKRKKNQFRKIISLIISIALLYVCIPASVSAEVPEVTYSGDANAAAVLKNLDYTDVKNSWAKEAIYEAGALDILKGYTNKRFGRTDYISKEEAIAIAYRAAGKEAVAQVAGEALNSARSAENKKTDPLAVWYDGYLQLAANDGLISQQDLTDALNTDQGALTGTSFNRKAHAKRQEIAFWLAKTLNLQTVRGQENIFNNYIDWRSADPDKVSYIEAVLQNKIMTGDGKGRFNPNQAVTREQAAQIIKNAEDQILPILQYSKQTGTIESIVNTTDYSDGSGIKSKDINVRNSNGKLHKIVTNTKELVVYKNGVIGNSSILKKGDRIEYITRTSDDAVKFVKVLSNVNSERYVAAQINSNDSANLLINVQQYFKMDYPDISLLKQNNSFSLGNEPENITYRYSKNVSVTIDGVKSTIDALSPDTTVILTINSSNTVTAIQSAGLDINSEENRVVKGIVEDNNPKLGYITLYNEDGTGTGKNAAKQLAALRTFNYVNQNKVEVLRNHVTAELDSIQTGDTAFLKLDGDGNITSISAVENYTVKYGKVLSKYTGEIFVEFENGTQQRLSIEDDTLFIQDKKLTTYDALQAGDNVKLLLNINNKSTDLKEVTIEGSEHFISNIYKGKISYINNISNKLNLLNLQVFNKGKWEPTDQVGITTITLSDNYNLYYGNKEIDIDKVNELLKDNEAYIAVETGYGGKEKAVIISLRNDSESETTYNDSISLTTASTNSFGLTTGVNSICYNTGSIVVKNGRLISGNSLANGDKAYVVVNVNDLRTSYNAGVVQVNEQNSNKVAQIYRGRIKQINENKDFTVESYSQLNGTNWEYYNTPKTFKLSFNTSLIDSSGFINIRNFVGYGDNSYLGQVVYVFADDTDAVLVSTAPYGSDNVKGLVYEISGAATDEDGFILTEPNSLKLRSAKVYNSATYTWQDSKDITLNILKNSIIIKDGNIIKASDIKKGDTIRVVKKDTSLTGDAYIIFVET